MENREFIVTIFTENRIGVLNRITAIYLRRKINIESLKVSPSTIKGISMFAISAFACEETIKKVVGHIKKIVGVIDAEYETSENLISQEIALYKISKVVFSDREHMEYVTRNINGRIIEFNSDYVVFEKTGYRDEVEKIRQELEDRGLLEQFTRSGSVVLHRISIEEKLAGIVEF